jgi:hypothetical protein
VNQARHLWTLAGEITAVIEHWLKEREGKLLYAHFSKTDMLRLSRLQVWSWRHKVPIDEILSLTLPYLRKSLRSDQKARYGLGCSIAALTGVGNEKILIEAIKIKYPGGEHRDIWRERERLVQIEREAEEDADGLQVKSSGRSLLECDSVPLFLESYRRRVLAARRIASKETINSKRRRKRYRGNPWL